MLRRHGYHNKRLPIWKGHFTGCPGNKPVLVSSQSFNLTQSVPQCPTEGCEWVCCDRMLWPRTVTEGSDCGCDGLWWVRINSSSPFFRNVSFSSCHRLVYCEHITNSDIMGVSILFVSWTRHKITSLAIFWSKFSKLNFYCFTQIFELYQKKLFARKLWVFVMQGDYISRNECDSNYI